MDLHKKATKLWKKEMILQYNETTKTDETTMTKNYKRQGSKSFDRKRRHTYYTDGNNTLRD